ncbi:MAG: hypothetical protein ACK5RL_06030 [Acidimicrobiales bacterium]
MTETTPPDDPADTPPPGPGSMTAENIETAGLESLTSLRELTYVYGDHRIEIEIQPGPGTVAVSGTVDPPDVLRVQLLVGGEVFAADLDETGGFEITGVLHGSALPFIDTPKGRIRLGSFEI